MEKQIMKKQQQLFIFGIIAIGLIVYFCEQNSIKRKTINSLKSIDIDKIQSLEITYKGRTISCYDKGTLNSFQLLFTKLLETKDDKSVIARNKREYYSIRFIIDTSLVEFNFGFPEDNNYLYLYCCFNKESVTFGYHLPSDEITEIKKFFDECFTDNETVFIKL